MTPLDRPLRGAPFPPTRLHPKLYAAEFVGTALLVGIGVSVVIIMFGRGSPVPGLLPSPGLRRFLTGGLFGAVAALIAVSVLGRISGAHINPAVTLAFWREGKIAWRDALGYVLAQTAGGVAGALPLLGWGSMGRSVDLGVTLPGAGVSALTALMAEAGVTGLMIVVLFTTAAHPCTRRFTPLTLPLLFSVLVWLETPISGTSANPARSLGPALVADVLQAQWLYVVGPCLGTALAVACLRLEITGLRRVRAARLFHFHIDEEPSAPRGEA
jgi:aquaporin Z